MTLDHLREIALISLSQAQRSTTMSYFALSPAQLRLLRAANNCTDVDGLPVMQKEERSASILESLKLVTLVHTETSRRAHITPGGVAELRNH